MQPEEARIASHVCADGCLHTYGEENSLQIVDGRRYRQERRRYEIRYYNNERKLLRQFAQDMKKVFDVNRNIQENYVKFRSKRIFMRLKSLGAGGSHEWYIADEIKDADDVVKRAWLQAFFDDEGTVDKRSGSIRLKSMNKKGLKDALRLMKSITVPAHITGQNCDGSWYLNINKADVPIFHQTIGFTHPDKQQLCAQSAKDVRENRMERGSPVYTVQ